MTALVEPGPNVVFSFELKDVASGYAKIRSYVSSVSRIVSYGSNLVFGELAIGGVRAKKNRAVSIFVSVVFQNGSPLKMMRVHAIPVSAFVARYLSRLACMNFKSDSMRSERATVKRDHPVAIPVQGERPKNTFRLCTFFDILLKPLRGQHERVALAAQWITVALPSTVMFFAKAFARLRSIAPFDRARLDNVRSFARCASSERIAMPFPSRIVPSAKLSGCERPVAPFNRTSFSDTNRISHDVSPGDVGVRKRRAGTLTYPCGAFVFTAKNRSKQATKKDASRWL